MTIIFEIAVALLMLATCGYCIALNRKLQTLRDGQADLLATIERFDDASRRAEKNLNALQGAGGSLNRELAAATARAGVLMDELSVAVNAGDRIAGRIEGAVSEARVFSEASKRLAS